MAVCVYVILVSTAKTAEPFGMSAYVGPCNYVLDGGPDPPGEGAILGLDIHGMPVVIHSTRLASVQCFYDPHNFMKSH